MEHAFAEMPLALFTTLASMGAGAAVALAVALFTCKLDEMQLRKVDRLAAIPLALVAAGFVAAFFHLTNALNAPNVLSGVGTSPLSNEVVAGSVFLVAAIVCWVLALAGKLTAGARRIFVVVVAVLAVVFALMMGTAYMIDTIPSWNTPLVPVQMLGFALAGGAAVASLVLAIAGASEAVASSGFKSAGLALAVVGAILGAGALLAQAGAAAGLSNPLMSGSDLVGEAALCIGAAVVALVASAACTTLSLRGKSATATAGAAVALAFVGILCARLAFYAMQISVGLCM